MYFDGLRQVPDPSIGNLTTAQGVRARSNLRAILDSSGRLLLVNPAPGTVGNLAPRLLEGPGGFGLSGFSANLLKRIRLTERKNLELRADADGLTNSPQFDNPITEINSPNFGRIFGAGGSRIVEVSLRLNF